MLRTDAAAALLRRRAARSSSAAEAADSSSAAGRGAAGCSVTSSAAGASAAGGAGGGRTGVAASRAAVACASAASSSRQRCSAQASCLSRCRPPCSAHPLSKRCHRASCPNQRKVDDQEAAPQALLQAPTSLCCQSSLLLAPATLKLRSLAVGAGHVCDVWRARLLALSPRQEAESGQSACYGRRSRQQHALQRHCLARQRVRRHHAFISLPAVAKWGRLSTPCAVAAQRRCHPPCGSARKEDCLV